MGRRPVVWFAVCWTAGYSLAYHWQPAWLQLYTSLACLMLLGSGLYLFRSTRKARKARSVAACFFIIIAAAGVYASHDRANASSLMLDAVPEQIQFQGVISSRVEVDGDRVSFTAASHGTADVLEGESFQVTVRLQSEEEQRIVLTWQRGDRLSMLAAISRPGEARNFGAFDYQRYLRFKQIHWQLQAKGLSGIETAPPSLQDWNLQRLLRWNDQFRNSAAQRVAELFPAEQSGFMASMLIGLTDDTDPEQFERFSRLGLTHILAISGMNVAIFLSCIMWLLRKLRMTKEKQLLLCIALVPLYVLVTGASPSIVRAGIMAMIGLYAAYRGSLKEGLHVAMLAGVGMLLWNPYYLIDVSFQLSFLVTLGLILGVPSVHKALPAWPSWLKDALAIALVAQAVSFPLTIYYFSQFSLMSLPANLILVPVFSLIIMPGGTIATLLSFIWMPAGEWTAWLVMKVNQLVFAAAELMEKVPGMQQIWPKPEPLWVLAYYCLLAALAASLPDRSADQGALRPMLEPIRSSLAERLQQAVRGPVPVVLASCALALLLWYGYAPDRWSHSGEVQFIDVGQGDSILIRSPVSGTSMLIDGGGTLSFTKPGEEWKQRRDPYEVGRKLVVPLLKQRGVQQLDYVVLTHQDKDHSGGLQAVLEHIPVKRLLFNGTLKREEHIARLFQTALDRGVELVPVYAGDKLSLDQETTLRFLYPLPVQDRGQIMLEEEQNGVSVVFHMSMSGTGWLFTGDIDQAGERELLEFWLSQTTGEFLGESSQHQDQQLPKVDVLKTAHHGSKSSTSELWLNAWKPDMAVISAGVNNVYGHPNPAVLERLKQYGAAVLSTHQLGEIQMQVNNGSIIVRTKLPAAN